MFTVKIIQESGVINLLEVESVGVVLPNTKAWEEYTKEGEAHPMIGPNSIAILDCVGGMFDMHIIHKGERAYIVNSNGKTVQSI